MKADAIEDGVVEISGSTLETDSIGGGHVEAEKVSDDQVAKIYEQSKSFGPKQVSLGEKVSGDGYTFTLTRLISKMRFTLRIIQATTATIRMNLGKHTYAHAQI